MGLMQGNCEEEPPAAAALGLSGAGLLPRVAGQCLVVVDRQLAAALASELLWVHALYLRYQRCAPRHCVAAESA